MCEATVLLVVLLSYISHRWLQFTTQSVVGFGIWQYTWLHIVIASPVSVDRTLGMVRFKTLLKNSVQTGAILGYGRQKTFRTDIARRLISSLRLFICGLPLLVLPVLNYSVAQHPPQTAYVS